MNRLQGFFNDVIDQVKLILDYHMLVQYAKKQNPLVLNLLLLSNIQKLIE